jgi:anti-anti-sigma regulatory factor
MPRFHDFFPVLAEEECQRRLGLFRVLLIVQVAATLALTVTGTVDALGLPRHLPWIVAVALVTTLFSLGGYFLARRGRLHLGALLLVASVLLALSYFTVFYGSRDAILLFFVWPILVSAILLERPLIAITTAVVCLVYLLLSLFELFQVWPIPLFQHELFAAWHNPADPTMLRSYLADVGSVLVGYIVVGVFVGLAAHSLGNALERSRQHAEELSRYREELQAMVESRTAELNRALESLQANLEVLREIGSPILPIFSGVILVPLVGAIDSARAERTMDAVLHGVYEHRARVVLLDITGVPTVDTAVANALVRTAQGVRLLGATPVLVGVRAEVAQTIVDLGIDLQGIVTQASLQEGLEYALRAQGVRLIAEAAETPSLAQRPWNR